MQRDKSYLFASSFAYIYNSIRFYSIFFTRLIQCNASRFGCASMYVCSRCLRISYRERLFRDGRTRREKRATLDSSDGISLRSEIEFLKIINNHTGGGGRIFNFNTSFFPSPREEEAAAFPSPRHVPLERIVSRFAGIKIPAAALMTGKSRA